MPEWLGNGAYPVQQDVATLLIKLVLAWLAGFLVALIAGQHKDRDDRDNLTITLTLMSILIAMATQIVGDNVARAFSLVGALSIVRFRTAVPSTRDVVFVLAAVVMGMAVGAGQYVVCTVGIFVLATTSLLARWTSIRNGVRESEKPKWRLLLVVGLAGQKGLSDELGDYCQEYRLKSLQTVRGGSALELVYDCVFTTGTDPTCFVAGLNLLQHVESVRIKEAG